ncbi:copper resistance protein B [Cycloclasticus pugetii]|jgi:copper resistance protein B|uniref:copper resistance protein B n=1 Tax=Cycloclasticus pugetii TaxID=34068 RepID=UPI002409FF9B|nr:copper resistance protein B [Cycloclasticus pugetii]MDF1829605.1 copper resistance protein B [Cycloclasticus pugetii]
MMKKLFLIICISLVSMASHSMGRDDPLLTKVMVGQFELRNTEGSDPVVLEAQGWVGKDLNKLWVKVDVENVSGKTDEAELQFLYSKAIAPYWDVQVGWRHDKMPTPNRDWFAVGFQGLAPYFFEIDAAAFIGNNGQTALRLEAEYEIMLTQKLILTPEVEINAYSKDDEATGVGSGLSDIELGLRLRYEIRREFAPYIGVNWNKTYGDTANFSRDEGEDVSDTQFVVGIRAWF